ncbi:MAG TPA: hypothetical protein PKM73_13795 [Verrucomicrobiota bacterium]|nr:hypothetical protein [Verrucomicrobiota bacterium]HNU51907.1 hypothetical protein [Verrucomicrobiota bacterium]
MDRAWQYALLTATLAFALAAFRSSRHLSSVLKDPLTWWEYFPTWMLERLAPGPSGRPGQLRIPMALLILACHVLPLAAVVNGIVTSGFWPTAAAFCLAAVASPYVTKPADGIGPWLWSRSSDRWRRLLWPRWYSSELVSVGAPIEIFRLPWCLSWGVALLAASLIPC